MLNARFAELQILYRKTLLEDVIPFWEKYSIDRECGGYYTCLNRDGTVFDTDKFIWLQARQVWMFSMLYNRLEKREAWREIARHGADFLRKHGMDEEGNWYFSLTRKGQPLVQSYNIFSDCFAAMAFSQYSLACGDNEAKQIAGRTYQNILRRKENPKGKYNKIVPGTRPMMSLGLPMILSNLTLELEWMLGADTFKQTSEVCLREIFSVFLDQKKQILREHAAPDGAYVDCFEGRLINPGHGIEAMWFVMDIAHRRGDTATIKKAVDVIISTLEFGWDKKHGGIFYFMDVQEYPPHSLNGTKSSGGFTWRRWLRWQWPIPLPAAVNAGNGTRRFINIPGRNFPTRSTANGLVILTAKAKCYCL